MDAFSNFIIRYRLAILISCSVLTLGVGAFMTRLTVDTDTTHYLSPTDPVVMHFNEVGATFGSNYTAVILIESADTFAEPVLQGIAKLTKGYQDLDGVSSVISLTNVVDIKKTDSGIEVADLIPNGEIPSDPAALAKLKRYVTDKGDYKNFIISENGRFSAIYINIAEKAPKDEVANRIRSATDTLWPAASRPAKVSYAGQPMIMSYMSNIIFRDMGVLVPLVVLLLLGILYVSFRSLRGVVLPTLAVLMATIWTFGIMGGVGAPLTLIAAIMPVVLIANGSASGIHMLNFIALGYDQADSSKDAVRIALRLVCVPIILSAITVFIGFISFVTSLLTIFSDFGIYTAIGIAAALVLALTFIPATVTYLKPPRKSATRSAAAASYLETPLRAVSHAIYDHPRLVLGATFASLLAMVPGIFMLETNFSMLSLFPNGSEPHQVNAIMTKNFGGTMAYMLHLRGPVKDPLVLGEMLRIEKRLRLALGAKNANSIADVIAGMNDSLNGQRIIPATKAGVESLFLLIDGKSQLNQLMTPTYDQALVISRMPEDSSAVLGKGVHAVDALLKEQLRGELTALGFAGLSPDKRAALSTLAAKDLLDDLVVDVRYRGLTLTPRAELLSLLRDAFDTPASPLSLSVEERRSLFSAYLAAEDCDLVIVDPQERTRLVAALAGLTTLDQETLITTMRDTSPSASKDAEGVKLAATSLGKLLRERVAQREHERLLGAVLASCTSAASAAKVTQDLRDDVSAQLQRLTSPSWAVTPAQYAGLMGAPPSPEAVTRLAMTQTGNTLLSIAITEQVNTSQINSLALCLGLVLIVLFLQLRSIRAGLIAMLPIIYTLVVNFGVMGYFGVALNLATSLIASMAIGIGIDYTIHTAYRLKFEARAGGELRDVLERTFLSTGRAVLINALAVMGGFAVIIASELTILKTFGGLSALSIGIAALGALTMYPVLVLTIDRRFLTKQQAMATIEKETPAAASQAEPASDSAPSATTTGDRPLEGETP